MTSIRVLPPEVVNQIAAGEVIERPFSVVKELVENSLDAGAKRLHVSLEEGGRSLIRVLDDGGGFAAGDLELAFVSHATSKLAALADLDHIGSLGFRGEALASIGSIAKVTIRSRQGEDGDGGGNEIRCEGGKVDAVRPTACAPGTVIEVRDLFFNTPARRRFLKTPRAEKARIQELLMRLALARPDVDFTLEVDGKQALRLPAGEALDARITRALGATIGRGLHPVESSSDGYRITGFTGDPDVAQRTSTLELLYINGRLARDKSAGYAIRQAYREHLMGGRYPVYVLSLTLPPADVDVNVHPSKAEVRFLDGKRVCGMLHDAVRSALAGRASQASEALSAELSADGAPAPAAVRVDKSKPGAQTGFPSLPRSLFDGYGSKGGDSPSSIAPDDVVPVSGSVGSVASPASSGDAVAEPAAGSLFGPGDEGARDVETSTAAAVPANDADHPFAALADRQQFVQIADLYLVFEGESGSMVVVDQHALHERVMYERLVDRYEARGEPAVQQLLVPEIVDLAPVDKAYLLDASEELAKEGLVLEDFGGDSIAVQAVPAVLDRTRPAALVQSFLDGRSESGARPRAAEAIHERFHSMACRAAIMSGDRLSQDEIRELLRESAGLRHPHNCPHGRPTVLSFSARELERFFRRVL